MMQNRMSFLSYFVLCLAISAGAWFAYLNHVPQFIFAHDVLRMSSIIGIVFLWSIIYMGWAIWNGKDTHRYGHLMEKIFPSLGLIGSVSSITMLLAQKASSVPGTVDYFSILATGMIATACGLIAMVVMMVMVFVHQEQRR